MKKYNYIIVGAGVAGLTVAYKLLQQKQKVLIIEKNSRIGGLAKSLYYRYNGEKFIFDLGPKIFHTNDQEVRDFIFEVLDGHYVEFERKCSVYYFNNYFNWPIAFRDLYRLPLELQLKVGRDVLKNLLFKSSPLITNRFSDYIKSQYGETLFNIFFKEYTEKFTCFPVENIHSDWVNAAVKSSINEDRNRKFSIIHFLKMALIPAATKLKAFYPRTGGFGYFSHRLAQMIRHLGGEILTSFDIEQFDSQHSLIYSHNRDAFQYDHLIWTGNLADLKVLLRESFSSFEYTATIFFNIIVDKKMSRKDLWLNFGNPDLNILRVSILNNFSSNLAPDNYTSLVVEKRCRINDNIWNNPENLNRPVMEELVKVGLIDDITQVKKIFVERVPDTYPIYDLEHREKFESISLTLREKYPKIKLLGRTGTYWYNNANHSIKMALEMAKYFSGQREKEPDRNEMLFWS